MVLVKVHLGKGKSFRYFKKRELNTKIGYEDIGKAEGAVKKNSVTERLETAGNKFLSETVPLWLGSQEQKLQGWPAGPRDTAASWGHHPITVLATGCRICCHLHPKLTPNKGEVTSPFLPASSPQWPPLLEANGKPGNKKPGKRAWQNHSPEQCSVEST